MITGVLGLGLSGIGGGWGGREGEGKDAGLTQKYDNPILMGGEQTLEIMPA